MLAVSCTSVETTKTIRLSLSGVETGAMTKVSSDDVASLIAATANPYTMTVTLVSKKNPLRTYEVTIGQSATVAVDEYTVSGEVGGGNRLFNASGGARVTAYPSYHVSQDLTVTEDVDAYTLDAVYDCFALVIDYSLCASYSMTENTGNMAEVEGLTRVGDKGIAYCTVGSWSSQPASLLVTPADPVRYDSKSFRLYSVPTGTVYVECGRWYCFSPGSLTPATGTFGVSTPDWTMGGQY